jgi:hypothetical protein
MKRKRTRHLVPSDMRQCFTRHGDRKRKYSERQARQRAVKFNQHAYLCPQCNGWHLASMERAS